MSPTLDELLVLSLLALRECISENLIQGLYISESVFQKYLSKFTVKRAIHWLCKEIIPLRCLCTIIINTIISTGYMKSRWPGS